jgi:hypothetical protein
VASVTNTRTKRFDAVRFYGRLLFQAPKAAWDALGHVGNLFFAGFAVLAIANRPLAKSVSSWEGISPLWAILPFGFFLLVGMLAANYSAFKQATTTSNSADGPELEIEEAIDSSFEPGAMGDFSKIKIAKASNCEFKTDVGHADPGEGSASA